MKDFPISNLTGLFKATDTGIVELIDSISSKTSGRSVRVIKGQILYFRYVFHAINNRFGDVGYLHRSIVVCFVLTTTFSGFLCMRTDQPHDVDFAWKSLVESSGWFQRVRNTEI